MKDHGTHADHAKGFTLIELLIVVSIISLLLGLLLPSLNQARSLARRVACQSNLHQIGLGVMLYSQEHNGYAPVAAPHELGGPTGQCDPDDPWLPPKMFGGTLPGEQRPLNGYLDSPAVFRSPADRGEPLWWFDTQPLQKSASAYQLYGSSYFYASGYNRMTGVAAPMGIAKLVGVEYSFGSFADTPLPLGRSLKLSFFGLPSRKIVAGSIPIHRTMSGVVAPNPRAQWYRNDPDHLWANGVFLDGHVEFLLAFPYDPPHQGINTVANPSNPYY